MTKDEATDPVQKLNLKNIYIGNHISEELQHRYHDSQKLCIHP